VISVTCLFRPLSTRYSIEPKLKMVARTPPPESAIPRDNGGSTIGLSSSITLTASLAPGVMLDGLGFLFD